MTVASRRSTITGILREIRSLDDQGARTRLFDAVYDELRVLARALLREGQSDGTFRPTELVHEVFIRLVEEDGVTWENRAHFFGIAARAMRRILVDHAREKAAQKRGGDRTRISYSEEIVPESGNSLDLLVLHDALDRLAALDERAAKVAEMRIFAGLTSKEIAHLLDISRRTADGDWITARSWLSRELAAGTP